MSFPNFLHLHTLNPLIYLAYCQLLSRCLINIGYIYRVQWKLPSRELNWSSQMFQSSATLVQKEGDFLPLTSTSRQQHHPDWMFITMVTTAVSLLPVLCLFSHFFSSSQSQTQLYGSHSEVLLKRLHKLQQMEIRHNLFSSSK